MSLQLNEQILNYAEAADSDEAEALLEAVNYAEENNLPLDGDAIVQSAVTFLNVLVEKGELMEDEKQALLELVEFKDDSEPMDESDILSDSVDGDIAA